MSTYYSTRGREIPYAIMLFLFLLPIHTIGQDPRIQSVFDKYLHQAKQDTFSIETRARFLKIAYHSLNSTQADSIKYWRSSKIVEAASYLQDSIFFKTIASQTLKLAENLENPAWVGDSHWNYGSYYLRHQKYDSSYYHYNRAYTFFMEGGREYYAGKMLYNMAYIASETNDLTGAEILLFRSIKIFERQHKPLQQYRCYNVLGNNADDMEEFEKSLLYYKRAEGLITLLDNAQYYRLENLNNLGVRLYKMKAFEEAITFFDMALTSKEVLRENPAIHAKLLDNKAYCLVSLGKYENVFPSMQFAMALRDSLGDTPGTVTSRLRFANYYGKTGDTISAITFGTDALQRAKENYLTRDLLNALELLARLDKKNALFYLDQHIELDKKISARDRNLRNKYTAIQYETDKYIAENKRLFKQRLWITVGASTATLILFLIFLNTRQRAKNKQLLLEREQQQYTEDMFLMAMENAATLERGRNQERIRISSDLHDGILARLFAVRFKWSYLNLKGDKETLLLHTDSIDLLTEIETDIRNISHDLRNELIWEEIGFKNEIANTIQERSEIGKFSFTLIYEQEEQWEMLDYLHKINLCRMLDEILQNIIKHACATQVTIHLFVKKNVFNLSIGDNGKGFSKNQWKKGIGLSNLKIRAKKLNANLEIESKPGKGTLVSICFSKKE